jgi:serine protease Do
MAQAPSPSLKDLSAGLEELSRRVSPSVVKVVAHGYRQLDEQESDDPGLAAKQQSSGAGVIISADGYVVTSAHVVQSAERVVVTLAGGRLGNSILPPQGKSYRARIVGLDPETDIALLKIEASGLASLPLGDSAHSAPGQVVLAFGSPMGLDNSVTMGVVSNPARQFKPDDTMIYIQTDAPINPGSSGGPLVDGQGRVLGINTLILSQSGGNEGLGFAVPSHIVETVARQLKQSGRFSRGEIGIGVQTVSVELAAGWKLPQPHGVVISDVEPDGPGDKAGLKVGDILLSLNATPMENARQFTVNLYQSHAGDKVKLDVLRDKEKLPFTVEVEERRDEVEKLAHAGLREENLLAALGLFITDATETLRETYGMDRGENGALVVAKSADGPFFDDGFRVGDVIIAINRETVPGAAGLRKIVGRLKPGDSVAVQVERAGKLRFVSFELP